MVDCRQDLRSARHKTNHVPPPPLAAFSCSLGTSRLSYGGRGRRRGRRRRYMGMSTMKVCASRKLFFFLRVVDQRSTSFKIRAARGTNESCSAAALGGVLVFIRHIENCPTEDGAPPRGRHMKGLDNLPPPTYCIGYLIQ